MSLTVRDLVFHSFCLLGLSAMDRSMAHQKAVSFVAQGQAAKSTAVVITPQGEPQPKKPVETAYHESSCSPGVDDEFGNCGVYAARTDWLKFMADVDRPVRLTMMAIAVQESAVSCSAVNPHSDALGFAQVMPFNLESWMGDAGIPLSSNLRDQFLSNCQQQVITVAHRMSLYQGLAEDAYNEGFRLAGENKERTMVRYIASLWYSGQGELAGNESPQYYDGYAYPSIATYTRQVLAHRDEIAGEERGFVSRLPEATGFNPVISLNRLGFRRMEI